MPPDKRKPPAGDRRLSGDGVDFAGLDGSDHIVDLPVSQLLPRLVRPGELPELRALWWRQARLGHRLPAEFGIILIEGGVI